MNTVFQAYRFALEPTPQQQTDLRSHCGGQRYAYNWGLARIKANLGQRAAEKSYDIPDDQLTAALPWSAYSLRKDWNQAKDTEAPWRSSHTGERRGRKLSFPKFKGKRGTLSCRFTTGAIGLVDSDRRHVKLPRIGVVRTHESTRKLARHVERGTARIQSATISYRSGRWFCSFSVEITRTDLKPAQPDSVVSVDLGLKSLAVLSTGQVIPNPKHLDAAQRRLRRLNRQASRRVGPDKRSQQKPSNRWRKAQARVAKLHAQVANARRDGLHEITTDLVRKHGVIVLEDLNVSGMTRNRSLARHIADVGMAELRRQVAYKSARHGTQLVIARPRRVASGR